MTDFVTARDLLVSKINTGLTATYPSTKVFYENTDKVDVNTVGESFIMVDIDFLKTIQVTIEASPHDRTLGQITFRILYKEGKGTRKALQVFDYLKGFLKHQMVGGVCLKTPTPGVKRKADGWASFDLIVPFQFDSIS